MKPRARRLLRDVLGMLFFFILATFLFLRTEEGVDPTWEGKDTIIAILLYLTSYFFLFESNRRRK